MDKKILTNLEDVTNQSKKEEDFEKLQSRLAHYRAKSEQLADRVNKLLLERGSFEELIGDLKQSVVASDPYPRVIYNPHTIHSSPISPVAMVSDWQIGEFTPASETEGFGEFSFEIAQRRVFNYDEKLIEWIRMHQRAGFPIEELHILSLADHVSGNIHHELEVTNEFPLPVATANAGTLLGEFISRLAAQVKTVVVHAQSADNHGRLTHKNQWKQGAKNNMSWLVHVIAQSYLRQHQNVKFVVGEGTKQMATIQGKRVLLSHGHSVQMWMGIPYYGLERERAREATKRMNTEKTFDYVAIGHFHVPALVSGNIIINGNLPGTTPFDHSQGRHSPPSQVSFMMHPKHGLFNFTAWKL